MHRRAVLPVWFALGAALLISLAPWTPARADGPPSSAGRVHILMLIDSFGFNAAGLGFTHDGEALLNTLKTQLTRELGPGRCTATVLAGKEATAGRVLKYFRDLDSTPEDTLVFIGIAHGVIDSVRGHYLEMSSGRLYRWQLRQAMEARNPRLLVLCTGSCANPPYRFDRHQYRLAPPYPPNTSLKGDLLQPLPAARQTKNSDGKNHLLQNLLLEHQGVIDINASMAGTPAYASFGRHQYFVKGLVSLLQSPPAKLDANGDGFVAWQEFLPALQRQTAQLAGAEGVWQVPEPFLATPGPMQAVPNWLDAKQEIPLTLVGRTALILGSQGDKSLPLLQKALQSKQAQARRLALLSLIYMDSWEKRKALPLVQAALKDADPLTQALALDALRGLGPSKTNVAALEPLLQAKQKQLRRGALYALDAIGLQAVGAFPLLEKAYAHEDDPSTRADMIDTFSRIAPWKMQTWRAIEAGLKDKAPVVRRGAIYALYKVPLLAARNEVQDLLQSAAVRDEDVDVRIAALEALQGQGHVSFYLLALKHENPRLRVTALHGLPTAGPKAAAVLPDVIHALEDETPAVRLKALTVLEKFGPAARGAELAVEKMLRSESPDEALKAALVLHRLSPKNSAVLPALLKGLQDPALDNWERALYTVAGYGPQARPAISQLLAHLQHWDPFVRIRAIDALGRLGVDGDKVAPVLVKLLRDPNVQVRQEAVLALSSKLLAETKTLLPQLQVALKDSDPTVQAQATRIFVYWQDSSPAVLAVLFRELKDYSWMSRLEAVDSLAKLAPRNKAVIPYLINALKDKEPEVRRGTAQAVGQLGQDARKAEESLRELLKDADLSVRRAAALALWRVTGAAEPSLANLVQLTKHTSPAVRRAAAAALGEMGFAARPQTAALKLLLRDSDQTVRWAALHALARVDRRFTRPARTPRVGPLAPAVDAVVRSW